MNINVNDNPINPIILIPNTPKARRQEQRWKTKEQEKQ